MINRKFIFGFVLLLLPLFLEDALGLQNIYFLDSDIQSVYVKIKVSIYIILVALGVYYLKPFCWVVTGPIKAILTFFILPFFVFINVLSFVLMLSSSSEIVSYQFNEHTIHVETSSSINESSIIIYESCLYGPIFYPGKKLDSLSNARISDLNVNRTEFSYRIGKAFDYLNNSEIKCIRTFESSCMI